MPVSVEREHEILEDLGLDQAPRPRMELPAEHPKIPSQLRPKHWEAMQLVDPLETAAFERFIPKWCVVDQRIDPWVRDPDLSFAILCRTDKPPPVNAKLAAATRILVPEHGDAMKAHNYYAWLAGELSYQYEAVGATRMGRPLVFRAGAPRSSRPAFRRARKVWPIPFIGIHVKLVVDPTDGLRKEDMAAGLGVWVSRGWEAAMVPVDTGGDSVQSDGAPPEGA